MEPLAFVEIVDRHRDVLARHPVYAWPVRIGRGYASDVIVDDPFVAAVHVAIEPAADGRYTVSDLGTVNGIAGSASGQRLTTADVGPDDLVRLGHTQIRIRTPAYAVAPERPLRAIALYRRPATFMVIAGLTIALFVWNAWIMTTTDDDERYVMLFPVLGLVVAMGVWISIWSFVSSAVGRRPNFAAHGFVACAGIIALIATDSAFDYLAFAFDAGWVNYIGSVAIAVILGAIIYRHLRLNSRATRRHLVLASAGISAVVCGTIAGVNLAMNLTQNGNQDYSASIKAPAFLFARGTTIDIFLSDAEPLKRKVDALRLKGNP